MMRKKNDEVTGKPTQYNLQTLEYDWRELPDTHFHVKENGPRVRSYEVPAGARSNADRGNAKRNYAQEGGAMKDILGGGGGIARGWGGVGESQARQGHEKQRPVAPAPVLTPPSPTPAPMPSRPQQEAFAGDGFAGDANYPNVAAEGIANRNGGGGRLYQAPDADVLHGADAYAMDGYGGHGRHARMQQPGPSQPQPQPPVYVAPWSHEDLRRQALLNQVEANRSYLRQMN